MTEPEQHSFDDVAPDASAMIESMRAHGYTLPTAIADLVDNSIAAECSNIWLRFEWDGGRPWISITDDGHGMGERELVDAMRLGSRSPLEDRDLRDLGRFGLGLKTASFSQARRLTVISRVSLGRASIRRWDLDHLAKPEVRGWQLLRSIHPETGSRAGLLEELSLEHGTQVLLEVTDRVTSETSKSQPERDREDHFLWQVERVREHCAMVFHRFLARRKGRLQLHLNGELIEPWDPFLVEHPSTQVIDGYAKQLGNHERLVTVTGYVLPHRDRFDSPEEHRKAGGPEGWNAQQGFYLYRGERLIIAGDWLQLRWQKEEHYKLARIRLDIPNSMDQEWQVDVKKSTAAPPAILRGWLRGIAQEVRETARNVYSHRGRYGPRRRKAQVQPHPWKGMTAGDGVQYRIDRRHPILLPLIRSLSVSGKEDLEALLRLVEETVPVQRIWMDTAESQDEVALPFAGEKSSQLRRLIMQCYEAQVGHAGRDTEKAWAVLAEFDGFAGKDAQAIIEQLRGEMTSE